MLHAQEITVSSRTTHVLLVPNDIRRGDQRTVMRIQANYPVQAGRPREPIRVAGTGAKSIERLVQRRRQILSFRNDYVQRRRVMLAAPNLRLQGVVVSSASEPDRGLAVSEWIPGDPDAGGKQIHGSGVKHIVLGLVDPVRDTVDEARASGRKLHVISAGRLGDPPVVCPS